MENVQLLLNDEGFGKILIEEEGNEIAKMEISISENFLTAYHTEVKPEAAGRGLAKKLFDYMIQIVRDKQLKLIPLCVFVKKQLDKNPERFKELVHDL